MTTVDRAPEMSAGGQFLIYEAEDGRVKIDVRLADESVWLTQVQMADLFQTTQQNVSLHIRNVFDEGELKPAATHKKFLSVRQEGSRQVRRNLDHYNLDMIISVGYRVKSQVATRFRIWATQRLKEYIIKGFVLDNERFLELAKDLRTEIARLEPWQVVARSQGKTEEFVKFGAEAFYKSYS